MSAGSARGPHPRKGVLVAGEATSESDVARWLDDLGLGRYATQFAENAIDLEVLPELVEADLEKLGVLLGHRKKMLRAIANLSGGVDLAADPQFASPRSYTPKHLAERILNSRGALEGERKQVTVLFADIKGSLELIESGDPEAAHALLDPAIKAMMDAVHRYDGTVNKVLGDGVMALFGAPVALEDHAVRACYAALAIQDAIGRHGEEMLHSHGVALQVRVGLHSGEVVVRSIGNDLSMDYDAVGPAVHLAARMEQIAVPGGIRLTSDTVHLAEGFIQIGSLGPVPVKGLTEPVEVFELTGTSRLHSRLQAAAARGLSRFVGRHSELEALGRALEQGSQASGQVVAVVGEAGVGKSRLYYEFVHSHRTEGWLVLESSSVSYGRATPYLPVIYLLKAYFDIDDRDDARTIRERVTGKLLTLDETLRPALPAFLALLDVPVDDAQWTELDPSRRRQRTQDAIKALLLRESKVRPVVLVFEDLHWIDAETQTVLDGLIEILPTARLLLLVNYRPEYKDDWGAKSYYTRLRIDPLRTENAEELLSALLGDDTGLRPIKEILVERTAGNPFFLEESVRTLVETEALEGERGAYRLAKEMPAIEIPAAVETMLAARIDRLAPEDKHLLQSAAAIGKDVPFELLLRIAEVPEEEMRRSLAHLQGAEFLYETRLYPDLEFTFNHALTHEVAYGSLLAGRRRVLDERIVDAIEELHADRLAEHVERLAHHAYRGELWERAVGYLRQSGVKVAARSAYREAAASLEQARVALGHLPPSDETREQGIDLRFDLRSWLQPLGEHERVVEHLRAAEELALALGDQRRLGWASAYLSQYLWWMGDPEQADKLGRRALSIATEIDNLELRAVSTFFLGQGHFNVGDLDAAVSFCQQNVATLQGELAYRRLGLTGLPSVLSRVWLAWALAEQGEFPQAIAHAEEALIIAESAEQQYSITAACLGLGQVRLIRGDLAPAIAALERAIELSRTWGLRLFFPVTAGMLGMAYALSGRVDEVLPLMEEGEAEASAVRIFDTSIVAIALGTGYLLAGRLDEAGESASRAADIAEKSGFRGSQARIARLLGEIAARRDPPQVAQAEEHYRRALALADELGMRPLIARCHLDLGRLHRRAGAEQKAKEHLSTATALYRDLDMPFWLEQAEAEAEG